MLQIFYSSLLFVFKLYADFPHVGVLNVSVFTPVSFFLASGFPVLLKKFPASSCYIISLLCFLIMLLWLYSFKFVSLIFQKFLFRIDEEFYVPNIDAMFLRLFLSAL